MKLRIAGSGRPIAVATALACLLTTGAVGTPAAEQAAATPRQAAGSGVGPALTRADAQTKAAKSGKPVEVLSLRDERSTTMANPDGTFTLKQYVQPIRTRKDGEWTDIDTALVRQENGTYAPRAALAAMSISGGGDTTFAEIEKDARLLSLNWPTKLPKPEIDGPTARYANVLPDVDLQVTAAADGFSHVLVVKNAKAAANPDLARLELPVDTMSVTLEESADGGLTAIDTAVGGTVFEAPQPLMWDSGHEAEAEQATEPSAPPTDAPSRNTEHLTPSDKAHVADVSVDISSQAMTLTPDQGLLTGEDTVYPVYIDPVVKTANRTGWTMVSSYYSGTPFWKFSDHEGVGLCPNDVSVRCADPSDKKRQFFAIPTGTFEGKDIISAEFAVTMVHTYGSAAREVQLARVNSTGASAIKSSTTWSNQPSSKETIGAKSPTETTGSCTTTNQNVRFGVTSTVQKAADNGWDTTTFRLKAASESDTSYWKRFCGNAYLSVNYNRPPLQPAQTQLSMTPGGRCEFGNATGHYVSKVPKVSAVIKDYDHGDLGSNAEQLQAQFKVWWTNGSGEQVTKYATTGIRSTRDVSGENTQTGQSSFSYVLGEDILGDGEPGFTIPPDTVVAWAVRGYDQKAYGPWSTDGDTQTRCEFIYDTQKPAAASITSTMYPDDDAWHVGVGDYGSFTMDSPSTDVVRYEYSFTGPHADNLPKTAVPDSPGGPATVRWMPPSEGPYILYVTAIDGAGKPQQGGATAHAFLVSDGRAPVAAWALGDAAGSTKAVGSGGAPDATAGSGVTFGVEGPLGSTDTAASLDGTANAYLDSGEPAVDTSGTFSVSAWVMLPSLPTENVTVVSQDGTAQPGFELGYDIDSASWTFRIPVNDVESLGNWKVSGAAAVPDSWTHLIGVYDSENGMMMLYVNGNLVATDVEARHTAWNATGAVQIGRKLSLDGYTNFLNGSVADVKLHDRVIPEVEGQDLGGITPSQLAYWELDEASAGVSPESSGGTGLTLGGGASIYQPDESCDIELDPECTPPAQPVWGGGHMALNGTNAYATRAAGPLTAQDSFTVTARARLAAANPAADQTVVSLAGARGSAIKVKYLAASNRWQLVVTDADSASPVTTTGLDQTSLPSAEGDGDHLAVVYNAVFGDVVLYVNGVAAAQVAWDNAWDFTTTSLQVGRSLTATAASEYFSGAVDEVRMFQGPLDASLMRLVAVMPAGSSIEESAA
ncbi:laminin G [Streptomyces sp. AS58]|uniref:LamG-like jellyroll fold domain-containing protein n=1 Tax=Streptomyces sp. AS58 TaxID=1519489 RepID=UPI0006AFEE6A|nr:LamG-like jellyroll fold domain-containing protein [Streptomyces sp. AS58]KOV50719.1 laminin G [Streptomyces sp. AS58]